MSASTNYVTVCSGDEEICLPVDEDTPNSPPNSDTVVYLLSMENLKAFFPRATALFILGEQNKGLRIRNNVIEIGNLDLKYRVRFSEGIYKNLSEKLREQRTRVLISSKVPKIPHEG